MTGLQLTVGESSTAGSGRSAGRRASAHRGGAARSRTPQRTQIPSLLPCKWCSQERQALLEAPKKEQLPAQAPAFIPMLAHAGAVAGPPSRQTSSEFLAAIAGTPQSAA